jgi:uncharacterized OB-fold protein
VQEPYVTRSNNMPRGASAPTRVPIVDYLVLDDEPHLEATECTSCGARFFDRRNACAACCGRDFRRVPVSTSGELRAFTIVARSAPGIPVPFTAATVDCDGTTVRANLINIDPDPAVLRVGMSVRLTTLPAGIDAAGTEAVAYAFEPEEANGGQ